MPLQSRRLLVRSLLACLVLGTLIFGLSLRKIERIPLSAKPIAFDGDKSWTYMRDLAKGFPYRLPWHENRRKAGLWIKDQFRAMGYQPQGQTFSEVIAGKQYTDLENIYAEKRGIKFPNEIILAVGHYDTTDTTIEGAMDDASGVAVVLELARVLAKEQTDRTIIFMATDSEEFGAFWGAREFARNFDRSDQIVAALNFDFVAPETQTAILILCDGLKEG
ncbi:MAG: M28 family peptidase, partial [Bdellovibrionota bacterium]